MEVSMKVEGLREAFEVTAKAFPENPQKQRTILNSGMRSAANKTMVPAVKQLALQGDGSGALSESIAVRATSKKNLNKRRAIAGVQIVPVRYNIKALRLYVAHYYTLQGRAASTDLLASGIRHGHLVEFGSVHNNPAPFMLPGSESGIFAFTRLFVADLKKKTEAAIRRARKSK